jgi:hypothetical protein
VSFLLFVTALHRNSGPLSLSRRTIAAFLWTKRVSPAPRGSLEAAMSTTHPCPANRHAESMRDFALRYAADRRDSPAIPLWRPTMLGPNQVVPTTPVRAWGCDAAKRSPARGLPTLSMPRAGHPIIGCNIPMAAPRPLQIEGVMKLMQNMCLGHRFERLIFNRLISQAVRYYRVSSARKTAPGFRASWGGGKSPTMRFRH